MKLTLSHASSLKCVKSILAPLSLLIPSLLQELPWHKFHWGPVTSFHGPFFVDVKMGYTWSEQRLPFLSRIHLILVSWSTFHLWLSSISFTGNKHVWSAHPRVSVISALSVAQDHVSPLPSVFICCGHTQNSFCHLLVCLETWSYFGF